MTAASPTEWLAAGSLGVSAISLIGLALAFADADFADFDPRPALSRAVESGRVDGLLIAVANAKYAARTAPRDAAITAAALLALLIPASPERATR